MKCPSWLLKIIFSYLSNRSLIVTFNNATAKPKALPAGAPAGTVLGVFIFIIKINGLLLRPRVPRQIPRKSEKNSSVSVKYMDDANVACSLNLKACLISDPVEREKPVNYFEKNKLILPDAKNPAKPYLDEMLNFSNRNEMKINQDK